MKKITLALIALIFAFSSKAQLPTIDTLYFYPSSLTTNDSVKLVYSATFSSGACDMLFNSIVSSNDTLYIDVNHCEGMLTFICTSTDTINLGLLPSGMNHIKFKLLLGVGDFAPCNNFLPKDSIETSIVVEGTNSINELADNVFIQFHKQKININSQGLIHNICVYDINGKMLVKDDESFLGNKSITLPNSISDGLYIISYIIGSSIRYKKIVFSD